MSAKSTLRKTSKGCRAVAAQLGETTYRGEDSTVVRQACCRSAHKCATHGCMRAYQFLLYVSILLFWTPGMSFAVFRGLPCRANARLTANNAVLVVDALSTPTRCKGSGTARIAMSTLTADYSASDPPNTPAQLAKSRYDVLPLFYNDVYRVDLPDGHRFPMEKYRLVRKVRSRIRDAIDPRTEHSTAQRYNTSA